MNYCPVHNISLTAVGMQQVCLKCHPHYARAGFSIELRHIF